MAAEPSLARTPSRHRSCQGPATLTAALYVLLAAAAPLCAEQSDRQIHTLPLGEKRALVIEITVGEVTIVGSARADAEVVIDRTAPSAAALAALPVELREEDGVTRLRVVQSDGTTNAALRSTLTVQVPRTADIRAIRVVEGHIRLSGLSGAVRAEIARGPIHATDLSGTVRLDSTIGDVVLDGARLTEGGLLRLRTFNGDIRLTFASRPADARILALALNGTIASDLPLTTKDTWGPRWGEASFGTGAPVVSLDVVTGRITIKAPPAAPNN